MKDGILVNPIDLLEDDISENGVFSLGREGKLEVFLVGVFAPPQPPGLYYLLEVSLVMEHLDLVFGFASRLLRPMGLVAQLSLLHEGL